MALRRPTAVARVERFEAPGVSERLPDIAGLALNRRQGGERVPVVRMAVEDPFEAGHRFPDPALGVATSSRG
jgi:hypothetical protein